MAKKRRIIEKEVEEEYEFIPPEFDEKEFILKDIYGTKVLMAVALLSVIIGILCSCVQKAFGDSSVSGSVWHYSSSPCSVFRRYLDSSD